MNACLQLLLPLLCSLSLLPRAAISIKCYECYTVTHPYYTDSYIARKLCKDFDYSEEFIIDCGNSTYCRKTTMKEVIMHTLVETERGCASQLYVGLTLNNGVWSNDQRVVKDVYREECNPVGSYGLRNAKVENCYCNTDLCNSSTPMKYSVLCLGLSVILFISIY